MPTALKSKLITSFMNNNIAMWWVAVQNQKCFLGKNKISELQRRIHCARAQRWSMEAGGNILWLFFFFRNPAVKGGATAAPRLQSGKINLNKLNKQIGSWIHFDPNPFLDAPWQNIEGQWRHGWHLWRWGLAGGGELLNTPAAWREVQKCPKMAH